MCGFFVLCFDTGPCCGEFEALVYVLCVLLRSSYTRSGCGTCVCVEEPHGSLTFILFCLGLLPNLPLSPSVSSSPSLHTPSLSTFDLGVRLVPSPFLLWIRLPCHYSDVPPARVLRVRRGEPACLPPPYLPAMHEIGRAHV